MPSHIPHLSPLGTLTAGTTGGMIAEEGRTVTAIRDGTRGPTGGQRGAERGRGTETGQSSVLQSSTEMCSVLCDSLCCARS